MVQPFNSVRSRGFTLVELLIVIVIIALLSVLAFVGMQKAKQAAWMSQSVSRVRAFADANVSYAADHNGRYVPPETYDSGGVPLSNWTENPEFLQYVVGSSIYKNDDPGNGIVDTVPEILLDPVVVRERAAGSDTIAASYGYNVANLDDPSGDPGAKKFRSTSNVRYPAQTAAFFTARDWKVEYPGRLLWRDDPSEGRKSDGSIAYRHNDRAIVVFFDGHSKTVRYGDIIEIDNSQGGEDSLFWGGQGR